MRPVAERGPLMAGSIVNWVVVIRIVTTCVDGIAILVNYLEATSQLELLAKGAPSIVQLAPSIALKHLAFGSGMAWGYRQVGTGPKVGVGVKDALSFRCGLAGLGSGSSFEPLRAAHATRRRPCRRRQAPSRRLRRQYGVLAWEQMQ